jgi:hypothetical protein
MKNKPPSTREWENLYQVAIEFKRIECWNWMWDSDLFGVQNPVSGEIGYCCVMGRLGEHLALAVYLGTEGLKGYLKIQSGEIRPSSPDALHTQKCLMVSFEDRKFLQKKDLQTIKTLGLEFRGRNSWPLFRSYRPGYYPWYLTSEEAKFLTLALYQAIDVSLHFKDNPEMLTPPIENQYLVRLPEKKKDSLSWRDEWLEPHPLEKTEIVAQPLDVNLLERINKTIAQRQGTWEIDFFYSPEAVKEKEERPYYPYVILWADHHSGLILHFHLAGSTKGLSKIPEQFMKLAEKIKSLPQEILVKKEETFKLLVPITRRLGIKLRDVERLMALEEAQTSMFKFFIR